MADFSYALESILNSKIILSVRIFSVGLTLNSVRISVRHMSDVIADVIVVTAFCRNYIRGGNSSTAKKNILGLRLICEALYFINLLLIKGWEEFLYIGCVVTLIFAYIKLSKEFLYLVKFV